MKFLILACALISSAFAADVQSEKLLSAKLRFEEQSFALKISHEQEINRIQKKLFTSNKAGNQECVDWVYQGPSSRIEAVEICRGFYNMECAQWVYQGPSSRVEAIEACRGNVDMECARYVYQGPSSRVESVEACRDGRGGHRPQPRPDHDDCSL